MIYKDVDLEKLFRLMKENDITETTLRDGKTVVMVKRGKEQIIVNTPVSGAHGLMESHGSSTDNRKLETHSITESDKKKEETIPDLYYTVTAPLVGTFYRSSSPSSDQFVEVGDRVKVGDVLCIVEAMKSMNEIQSDVNGVIREICVENSQMVEFEQALFKIDTAG
jgi:acetyl-CoA carboxylase biotin carboxyl carrier protein